MGQKNPGGISDPALSGPRVARVMEQQHIAKEKLRGKLAEAEAKLEKMSLESQEEAEDVRGAREVRAREDYQQKALEAQASDLEHRIERLGAGVEHQAEVATQQQQQQRQQQQPTQTDVSKESTPSIEADKAEPGKSKPADLGRTLREAVDKAKSDAQRYVEEFEVSSSLSRLLLSTDGWELTDCFPPCVSISQTQEIAEQSKEAFGQFVTGYRSKDEEESSSSSREDKGDEVGMPAGTGPMEIKTSPSGDTKRKAGIKDKVFHALGLQPDEDVHKEYDTRSIDKAVARPPRR